MVIKMQIAVCDDCCEDRQKIKGLVEEYGRQKGYEIEVAEYSSGEELCSDMNRLKEYAVIFLDINMEKTDGLMTAKKIKDIYPELPIVLVTAFLNYVLEGYKVKASRFLVKDDLEITLPECLNEILEELRNKNQKVSFPFVEGSVTLEAQKIIYIETERHKNIFHTTDEVYGLYRKLDEIEAELAPYGFLRVHQSFLVNMRYVEKISSYVLRLITGTEISVPKSRYPDVKKKYAAYKGA